MKLRTILVNELEAYFASKEYARTEIIPITRQRVESQVHNPRANPEDPALILAEEENGNVLGFIGLLPDYIFQPEKKKVYWISCWWVHSTKGKSLGVPLLLAAYQATGGLLLADSVPETLSVFQKSKLFVVPHPKTGLKIFLKPLIKDVLIRKKPGLKPYSSILHVVDLVLSWIFKPVSIVRAWIYNVSEFVTINEFPLKNTKLLVPPNSSLFQRGIEEFPWIGQYPWIMQPKKEQETRFYPFSRTASEFKYFQLEIQVKDPFPAFLFLSIRNGVVKLCYAHVENQDLKIIAKSLLAFLYKIDSKEFISFHGELNAEILSLNLPFILKLPTKYQYVWGKPLGDLPLDKFQYGDGDAIFT